ncbi:MAG: FecCD family ABC transporter permease [Planctomycetota bacterium]|jgi:iron complex transport system permease protein
MAQTLSSKKLAFIVFLCLLLLILVLSLCSLIGTQDISLTNVFKGPSEQPGQNIDYEILVGIRLPRVILAAIVGAALAACGVVLQAILRNPLAEPYILGISSGAGLGVIIAFLSGISFSFWGGSPIAVFAFAGSLFTVWLVWLIGYFTGGLQVTSLLLAGVVVNAFFSAVIMFLTSIAGSEQLRATVFWLMGNITEKPSGVLWFSGICIISGITGLFLISNKLNALSLGEQEAKSIGVEPGLTKLAAFFLTAFITAVAVSLSGLIGFVGLIVPHGVRLVLGPDHRKLLPVSAIIGAIFLVIADTIARTVFGQEQLPVGVITAITGGPFFLILLARYCKKVSWLK